MAETKFRERREADMLKGRPKPKLKLLGVSSYVDLATLDFNPLKSSLTF